MNKKNEAFRLFDEGKKPSGPEVVALKLKGHTRYSYYCDWKNRGANTSLSKDEAEHLAKMAEQRKKRDKTWGLSLGDRSKEKPFRVCGEINLGTIDLKKERDEALAELRELNRNYSAETYELREQLHRQELEIIRLTFEREIERLTEMIKAISHRATFLEELQSMREVAEALGYQLPKVK